MQQHSSNIAILFFSRSAEAETEHKRFANSSHNRQNAQVADSLIAHAEHQIRKTDLPCFTIDETRQVGSTFGERFTNAFQEVFDKGFEYVISVGNDTPQLSSQHIEDAAQRLRSYSTDIVLGPDTDGGTWLMGYHENAFNADSFRRLPWNSADLLNTILQQSGDNREIDLLEELSDIDDACSLQAFARQMFTDLYLLKLAKRITAILSSTSNCRQVYSFSRIDTFSLQNNHLRAPPVG